MSTPDPPAVGALGWGTTLDAYLQNTLQPLAQGAEDSITAHTSAAPPGALLADPHGDRAFALELLAPIVANINGASGFVQLGTGGALPGGPWTDLRPVSGSFTVPAFQYPPQYRMTLDGGVRLAGYVSIAAGTYNGVTIFPSALPPAARPNMNVSLPVVTSDGAAAMLTVTPDGTMSFGGLPDDLTSSTFVGIFGYYPLDSFYGLIEV